MALVRTTLSSACAVGDKQIVVASATGFAAGYLLRIDGEVMLVAGNYSSGTTVNVIRGQQATYAQAHVSGAGVVVGTASDWAANVAPQTVTQYPMVRARLTAPSITSTPATPAIADLCTPGSDTVVQLNGTSVIALTVPVPTKDMDGDLLYIASNGAAAHTVTFTGGLSGASSNYDVITINATAPVVLGPFMAVNSLWQACVAVPMAGTVTNITATVA